MARCGQGYTGAEMVIDGVETFMCRVMTADEKHTQKTEMALILGITLPAIVLIMCFVMCCGREQSHARAVRRAEADAKLEAAMKAIREKDEPVALFTSVDLV